jgi:hypothetical protein
MVLYLVGESTVRDCRVVPKRNEGGLPLASPLTVSFSHFHRGEKISTGMWIVEFRRLPVDLEKK